MGSWFMTEDDDIYDGTQLANLKGKRIFRFLGEMNSPCEDRFPIHVEIYSGDAWVSPAMLVYKDSKSPEGVKGIGMDAWYLTEDTNLLETADIAHHAGERIKMFLEPINPRDPEMKFPISVNLESGSNVMVSPRMLVHKEIPEH